MNESQRIGVFVGSSTGHQDLSFRAGEAIAGALTDLGHRPELVFTDRDVDVALRQTRWDSAFLSVRGRYATDGCLQGLLEVRGVPFTGSGVLASALSSNRAKTRELFRLHNLPTAAAYVLDCDDERPLDESHGSFGFPVWVIPVGADRGLGVSLAHDENELEGALEDAFRFSDQVMVERFVDGRALEVVVLHGTAIGAWELGPVGHGGADLQSGGHSALRTRMTPTRYRSILRLAEQSCEVLGVEGLATVETILSDKANEVIRSVDASPWLLPGGLVSRVANAAGLSYNHLVQEVLAGARLRAHGHRQNRRQVQIRFDGPERRQSAPPHAH